MLFLLWSSFCVSFLLFLLPLNLSSTDYMSRLHIVINISNLQWTILSFLFFLCTFFWVLDQRGSVFSPLHFIHQMFAAIWPSSGWLACEPWKSRDSWKHIHSHCYLKFLCTITCILYWFCIPHKYNLLFLPLVLFLYTFLYFIVYFVV